MTNLLSGYGRGLGGVTITNNKMVSEYRVLAIFTLPNLTLPGWEGTPDSVPYQPGPPSGWQMSELAVCGR